MIYRVFREIGAAQKIRTQLKFVVQRFVYDRAPPPTIEKLWSKSVAMHTYGVSVCHAYTKSQLNGPEKEPMNKEVGK